MKPRIPCMVAIAVVAGLTVHAQAEKAPLSLGELQKSDLIVVGTIKQIRIESEPSRIERSFGNYDWGIYVTLAVEHVEKGELTDTEIEFRCFRIKTRRSQMEFLTPSGHRPIPGPGKRIRAYLNGGKPIWFAALPNGITAPGANDDASVGPSGRLGDADQVAQLPGGRFTYFLPLEQWAFIFVVAVPLTFLAIVWIRWLTGRRKRNVRDPT